jgi:hypothetical protein
VLVLSATGILTGLQAGRRAAVQPNPRHLHRAAARRDESTPTFGATIVYTDDGSRTELREAAWHYLHATGLGSEKHGAACMACSLLRAESLITSGIYAIKPPEARSPRPTFSPAAGTYISTQSVTIATATADCVHPLHDATASPPTCTIGTAVYRRDRSRAVGDGSLPSRARQVR